jgi:hypothetical protein
MHESTPIPIHENPTASDAVPDDAGATSEAPPDAGVSGIDQAIDILIGLVTLGVSATTSIVRGTEEPTPTSENAALVAGAAAGFLIEGLRAAGAMLTALERTVVAPAAAAAGTAADRPEVRELLEHWQGSWELQRERGDPAASDALKAGIRRGADALLGQLDLTDLVIEHLDVQRVAEQIDMDRLAGRIDIDALVARLDVEAVIDRLDMASIVAGVIEQLDLPELIRETTADATSEGVHSARLRGADADRALRRAVDRLLARDANDGSDGAGT